MWSLHHMLPARVLGFNLDQKTWGQFLVNGFRAIKPTDENSDEEIGNLYPHKLYSNILHTLKDNKARPRNRRRSQYRATDDAASQSGCYYILFHGMDSDSKGLQVLATKDI